MTIKKENGTLMKEFLKQEIIAAVTRGDIAHIDLCLQKGADVNTMRDHGTPLTALADYYGKEDIVEHLLKRGAHRMPVLKKRMLRAVKAGDTEKIDDLLKEGVDINMTENGDNLLLTALRAKEMKIITHLLDRGANIDAAPNGNTVLTAALSGCKKYYSSEAQDLDFYAAIADMLIDRGANATLPVSPHHHTPLHLAVAAKHEALTQKILAKGADPFDKGQDDKTVFEMIQKSDEFKAEEKTAWKKIIMAAMPDVLPPPDAPPAPIDPRVKEDTTSAPMPELKKKPFTPGQSPAGGA